MQSQSKADFESRRFADRILKTAVNNFVERPWGGTRLREFKALCPLPDQAELTGNGLGESFEIAAFDDDPEAAQHPSKVNGGTGGWVSLPRLIRDHAAELLGEKWIRRYGRCIPLLPKFLNVQELLSVQGHPPGHTEAYVVVDAERGATIRLGFRRDIDPDAFRVELEAGRAAQREFADLLGADTKWHSVQRVLADWFAARDSEPGAILPVLSELCTHSLTGRTGSQAAARLKSLRTHYWLVLDAMNEVPLQAGQVIYNCNPQRIVAAQQREATAEVHALGNPERRDFIMLEVRRPGPTLRAWDNVRFPMRDIDIDGALGVFNLEATRSEEYICSRAPLGENGHSVSVNSEYFRIEHVEVGPDATFMLRSADAHCLHVLAGAAELETNAGRITLRAGESALVPIGVGAYTGTTPAGVHLVKVHLP